MDKPLWGLKGSGAFRRPGSKGVRQFGVYSIVW